MDEDGNVIDAISIHAPHARSDEHYANLAWEA